jgi:hypothetical protein
VRTGCDHIRPRSTEGHIDGAKNFSHTRLADHRAGLPKDRPILVNCKSGGRSSRAVALLQRAGFRAFNIEGGYDAWSELSTARAADPRCTGWCRTPACHSYTDGHFAPASAPFDGALKRLVGYARGCAFS